MMVVNSGDRQQQRGAERTLSQSSNISPFLSRAPRIWTAIAVLLGFTETVGFGRILFSAAFMPRSIAENATLCGVILAVPIVTAFGYIVWRELSSGGMEPADIGADRWLVLSWEMMVAYMAFVAGWAATLLAFGARGPFGEVMNGIGGPQLPLDEKYWPLVFIFGAAVILILAQQIVTLVKGKRDD